MHDSKMRLRTYRLSPVLTGSRGRLFLLLSRELYRAFLGAPVNGLLVAMAVGTTLFGIWIRGETSLASCAPLQLLLWPLLMALEEFFHILVFLQNRGPDEHIELVTFHKVSRKGRRLICYGGAVRFGARLGPVDRIQISAPGPAMGLFGILLLWTILSLVSGSLCATGAHLAALPTLLYLLSGMWPCETPFPTDMSNILRAKREGELSWKEVLRMSLVGLGLALKGFRSE